MDRPAVEDGRIVERQIGRPPRGMIRVESRCAFGYPVSISVAPLVPHRRGKGEPEPFPTLFWLTCPALVEEVSRLESAGVIAALEAEAAVDPAFGARLREDHRRYAAEREGLLAGGARDEAARRGLLPVLEGTGVGGCRSREAVKCLHAHYAHHRARGGNAVGEILDARHGPRECTPGSVRCDAFRDPPAPEGPAR